MNINEYVIAQKPGFYIMIIHHDKDSVIVLF